MRLQELPIGSKIVLEVDRGGQAFSVQSEVKAFFSDGIAIDPIMVQGTILNVEMKQFASWKYNLYAYVGKDKTRVSWKNVQVKMVRLASTNEAYYVKTYGFATDSMSGERRKTTRYPVALKGMVRSGFTSFLADLNDVSVSGISFFLPPATMISEPNLSIRFREESGAGIGEMEVFCQIARRVSKDNKTLIGCRINKCSNSYIAYIRYLSKKNDEEPDEVNR